MVARGTHASIDHRLQRSAPCPNARLHAHHALLTPRWWPIRTLEQFWQPSHKCARLRPTVLFLNSELYARRVLDEGGMESASPEADGDANVAMPGAAVHGCVEAQEVEALDGALTASDKPMDAGRRAAKRPKQSAI